LLVVLIYFRTGSCCCLRFVAIYNCKVLVKEGDIEGWK